MEKLIEMADKLGTTAEYLWGALLRQAPVTGAVELLVMVTWIVGIVAWARYVRDKSASWHDEIDVAWAWTGVIIAAISAAVVIGTSLSSTVAALINPEYWALQQLLTSCP